MLSKNCVFSFSSEVKLLNELAPRNEAASRKRKRGFARNVQAQRPLSDPTGRKWCLGSTAARGVIARGTSNLEHANKHLKANAPTVVCGAALKNHLGKNLATP